MAPATRMPPPTLRSESRYARVAHRIATDRCVILDGATGSELIDVVGTRPELDEHLWGVSAILEAPDRVQALHRRYAEIGCDIVTTDTWGLATAVRDGGARLRDRSGPVHWMDIARRGVRLARAATADAGRADEVAVAFSINGEVDTPDGHETIRLLARAFEADPPDLILVETMSLVRSTTYQTIERLLATGLPVWLGFRRCRHGVCGVYGEHWGGPEGDAFGRAARRFEELGVGALLINCIPPDHATGMVSWLRDFTDLPLGVYPNLGYLSSAGWRHDAAVEQHGYAELALAWREEGAQIIGGCCGVRPERIAAARAAARRTPRPGHPAGSRSRARARTRRSRPGRGHAPGPTPRAGRCTRSRSPTSPSIRASPAPARRPSSSGSTSSASVSAPGGAASTSAARAGSRPSPSPSPAPHTCMRSTRTPRPSRTRSRTHFGTASPASSRPPRSTSTRGSRRSATT